MGDVLDAWRAAAERDPKNPFYLMRIAAVYVQLAGAAEGEEAAAEREEFLREAMAAAEAALALKPDYGPAHVQLAAVALMRGEAAEAIARTESAIAASPRDASLRFELGLLYLGSGNRTGALEQLSTAVALNPEHANARYFTALLLEAAGDRAGALQQFERLLADDPQSAMLQQIIGNLREGRAALEGVADAPSLEQIATPIAQEPEVVAAP
jgi:tetratricopeptide (TPR) repeat protein